MNEKINNLFKKVDEYFEKKDYANASKLLTNYLDENKYLINLEEQEQIDNYLKLIENNIKYDKNFNDLQKYNSMSNEQLLNESLNNYFNHIPFNIFIERNNITNENMKTIEKFLLRKDVENWDKTYIFSKWIQYFYNSMNNFCKIYNNKTKNIYDLSNQQNYTIYMNYHIEAEKFLNSKISKNPSIKENVFYVLNCIQNYYIGTMPPYTAKELSQIIVNYVNNLLIDYNDHDYNTRFIEKILSDNNN